MSQRDTNEYPLPDEPGEATLETEQKGETGADVTHDDKAQFEAKPKSRMDFFTRIFFQK